MTDQAMKINDFSANNSLLDFEVILNFGSWKEIKVKESSTSDSSVDYFPTVFLSEEGNISQVSKLSNSEFLEYKAIKKQFVMAISKYEDFEED